MVPEAPDLQRVTPASKDAGHHLPGAPYTALGPIRPDPQGHGSLRPSFSKSSLWPPTTRSPRLTSVSDGNPISPGQGLPKSSRSQRLFTCCPRPFTPGVEGRQAHRIRSRFAQVSDLAPLFSAPVVKTARWLGRQTLRCIGSGSASSSRDDRQPNESIPTSTPRRARRA
jgi:hypothetical protein